MTWHSFSVALLGYLAYLLVLFLGARFLPGPRRLGQPLSDGSRKEYKLTGLTLFLLTHAVVAAGALGLDLSLTPLLTHFWELFLAANLVALVVSAALQVLGRRTRGAGASDTEPQGPLKDLFWGIELNPSWFGVDLKMFAYQPSLIGLGLLNAAFAFQQYEQLHAITPQMWIFQAGWWIYLLTHYLREGFLLQIWDVIAERFGFGLVWGDLVLVPFFYSIIGWTLVDQTTPLPTWALGGIAALFLLGLWIFRAANAQKHHFKQDPAARIWGRPAETLDGRLLVAGFWGIGRHLNYTGEILVYLALALTAGLDSVLPFLLPLWLLGLLVHRAWRDERRCLAKYGPLWERYCARARFRMIPWLY